MYPKTKVVRGGTSTKDAIADQRRLSEGPLNGERESGLEYGTIACCKYRKADGTYAWRIIIPGTDGNHDSPMDWYTNFELMSADERQRGTAESLRFLDETMKQAGIQPDDPVEIVGHSQGGIIAAAAATDFQDKYDIQHIATLGSPIANFEIPEKTRVTAIEMDDEGIAALDGEANPHTENWLTIRCSVHEEDAPKRAFPGAEVSDSSGEKNSTHYPKYHEAGYRYAYDTGNKSVLDHDRPGVKPLTDDEQAYLRSIPENFGAEGIAQHAAYEAKTHHDVKAVEYYIDDQLEKAADVLGHDTQLTGLKTLVHFACTSEDINNLSIARCVKNGVEQVWLPAAQAIVDHLAQKADAYRDKAMLSLTHGQPATPTTLGKELAVYVYRLNRQLNKVKAQEYLGKINGATGTFGAHLAACPDVDWVAVSREFVTNRMGLTWNPLTTQIESHDWQAELYGTISHTNRILHNLCVDVWMYISRGVFAQVPVKGATGSSTMPHKVNPIRFENAEANLEISCSLLDTLSATLVESRWQRDLTDSTTQRNIGSALGYSLLALNNLMGGLNSIHPNDVAIQAELDSNWEVLGEPIQTAMRACELAGLPGMDKPYEKVKELMRGHEISKDDVERFIDQQAFDKATAARLKALTPATYTGVASKLVDFDR